MSKSTISQDAIIQGLLEYITELPIDGYEITQIENHCQVKTLTIKIRPTSYNSYIDIKLKLRSELT